ncbi:MAG TPA: rod shape-determining protein RodA [Bacteroidia bacterium]|nr:MAG: rod shape-determining protein RodA [Bacteroidetes bacterium OLB10]MBV6454658.1 Peptidoglycan glycosyltransferase MrdB [Bacteroidia bacterium]MBX3106741.1 rod shape-determining protein RodA [Bacteroidota bacterium]OQB61710.1 MAG: Rod shape-determining protein RodA [Bacteroidetes bacterium ADurb.Bin141]MCB0848141.1 rod shape-determining protein RodA [Bacteroidota bacterium]
MRQQKSIFQNIDWLTILLYLVMVIAGWLNIFAAVYNEDHNNITDLTQNYGKQMIWIATSLALALAILIIDGKFYEAFSGVIYGISILSLIAVLIFGHEVAGSKSWFRFGDFGIQPAEFAKFATALMMARLLSPVGLKKDTWPVRLQSFAVFLLPVILILLENETGVALVFFAFTLVLYRENIIPGWILLLGILATALFIISLLVPKTTLMIVLCSLGGLYLFLVQKRKYILPVIGITLIAIGVVFSVDYVFNNVLESHQKKRIQVLLGMEEDLRGAGYNVNQSKIAIGSGGLLGKGFLKGTQTKYNFVPEQSTDFIFCTVGEEWGFVGTTVVILLFLALLYRIVFIAERQKSAFARIYGYGVAAIIFFHFFINIGMTIGLMPVIGIPLPFFSYGGSSLWGFTVLLFILIKLDSHRTFMLR